MNNSNCQFGARNSVLNQPYRFGYRYGDNYENSYNHRSSNNSYPSPNPSDTDNMKPFHNSNVKQPDPNIIKQVIDELDPITLAKIQQQISLRIEDLIRPARKVRKSGVPRPQNLFVIFRKDYQARLIKKGHDVGALLSLVSKEASEQWKIVDQSIKDIYDVIANMARK
ncbi:12153_t:CDS:1, partial [Cetraspora pellucida]